MLLLKFSFATANTFTIETIDRRLTQKYKVAHVFTNTSCSEVFMPNLQESGYLNKIISFANEQFIRRGWSADFLLERYTIAAKYQGRSRYITVSTSEHEEDYVGTVGFTWANSNTIAIEKLPMEESHHWNLPRPLDKQQSSSIIFELRTYAIAKDAKSKEVFDLLFSNLINSLNVFLESRPDLFDENILYTYGDEVSTRMYRLLGFQNNTNLPTINHLGSEWSVLSISPKKLFENIRMLMGNFYIYNNSNISLSLTDAQVIFDGQEGVVINGQHKSISGVSATPLQLDKLGLEFSSGASLYFRNQKPNYLQKLKTDYRISEDLTIPAGSSVQFSDKGQIEDIEHTGKAIKFLGMSIPKYSQIYFGMGKNSFPTLITILNAYNSQKSSYLLPKIKIRYAQIRIEKITEQKIRAYFYANENTIVNGIVPPYNSIIKLTLEKGQEPLIEIINPS